MTHVIVEGAHILTGCTDGYMRHFDVRAGECTSDYIGGILRSAAPITCMDINADKKSLVISDTKSTIHLFNFQLGEELATFQSHVCQKYPTKCRIARDSSFFGTGSEDGICYLYNFLESKPIGTLYGHTDVVTGVDINRKSGNMITASFDGSLKYWVH